MSTSNDNTGLQLFEPARIRTIISFTEGYGLKNENLRALVENHRLHNKATEEESSKIRDWLAVGGSSSLCLSSEPPMLTYERSESSSNELTGISDATIDILATSLESPYPVICCFSDYAAKFKVPRLAYAIRCLVAQLYEHRTQPELDFVPHDFSDIMDNEETLKDGVGFITQLLSLRTKQCTVIIDDFQALYEESKLDDIWRRLIDVLQCQREAPAAPVKLFIRTSGDLETLMGLGFIEGQTL